MASGGWSPTGAYGGGQYSTGASTSNGSKAASAAPSAPSPSAPAPSAPAPSAPSSGSVGGYSAPAGGYTPSTLPAGVESITSGGTTITRQGYETSATLTNIQPTAKLPQKEMTPEQKYEAYAMSYAAGGGIIAPTGAEKEALIQKFGGSPTAPSAPTPSGEMYYPVSSGKGFAPAPYSQSYWEKGIQPSMPTITPSAPSLKRLITVSPTTVGFRSDITTTEAKLGTYEVAITPSSVRETQDIDERLGAILDATTGKPAADFTKFTTPTEGEGYDVGATALAIMSADTGFKIKSQIGTQIILEKELGGTITEEKLTAYSAKVEYGKTISDEAIFPTVGLSAAPATSAAGKLFDVRYFTSKEGIPSVGIVKGEMITGVALSDLTTMPRAYEEPIAYQARMEAKGGALGFISGGNVGAIEYFLKEKAGVESFMPIASYREMLGGYESFLASGGNKNYAPSMMAAKGGAAIIRGGLELPMTPFTIGIPLIKTLQKASFGEFKGGGDLGISLAIGGAAVSSYVGGLTSRPLETVSGTVVYAGALGASFMLGSSLMGAAGTSIDVGRMQVAKFEAAHLKPVSQPSLVAGAEAGDFWAGKPYAVSAEGANLPKNLGTRIEAGKLGISADYGQAYYSQSFISPLGQRVSVYSGDLGYTIGAGERIAGTQFTDVGVIGGKYIATVGRQSYELYDVGMFGGAKVPQMDLSYMSARTISPQGGRIIGGASISEGGGVVSFKYPEMPLQKGEYFVSGYSYSFGQPTGAEFTQIVGTAPRTTAQFAKMYEMTKGGEFALRDYSTIAIYPSGGAGYGYFAQPTSVISGVNLQSLSTVRAGSFGGGGISISGGAGAFKEGVNIVSYKGVGGATQQLQFLSAEAPAITMTATAATPVAQASGLRAAQAAIIQQGTTTYGATMQGYGIGMTTISSVISAPSMASMTMPTMVSMPQISSMVSLKPSVSVGMIEKTMTATRTSFGEMEILKPQTATMARTLTEFKTNIRPATTERQISGGLEDLRTMQNVRQMVNIRTELKQLTSTRTLGGGGGGGTITTFTPPKIPIITIPPIGQLGGGNIFGRGIMKQLSRSYKYAPSLTAMKLNLRGIAPTRLTGLELRPMGRIKRKRRK